MTITLKFKVCERLQEGIFTGICFSLLRSPLTNHPFIVSCSNFPFVSPSNISKFSEVLLESYHKSLGEHSSFSKLNLDDIIEASFSTFPSMIEKGVNYSEQNLLDALYLNSVTLVESYKRDSYPCMILENKGSLIGSFPNKEALKKFLKDSKILHEDNEFFYEYQNGKKEASFKRVLETLYESGYEVKESKIFVNN